jgi:hypothetical protein
MYIACYAKIRSATHDQLRKTKKKMWWTSFIIRITHNSISNIIIIIIIFTSYISYYFQAIECGFMWVTLCWMVHHWAHHHHHHHFISSFLMFNLLRPSSSSLLLYFYRHTSSSIMIRPSGRKFGSKNVYGRNVIAEFISNWFHKTPSIELSVTQKHFWISIPFGLV